MPVSQINSNSLATGVPARSNMPAGSVLQVVSTNKTDTFTSATTGSFTDITGMSATITPTNSANKVLVTVSGVCSGQSATSGSNLRLLRGSTAIGVGDTAGSRSSSNANAYQGDGNNSMTFSFTYLDSPATTSATTYKIQFITSSGTFYFNRSQTDTDSSAYGRYASSITLMEIAA